MTCQGTINGLLCHVEGAIEWQNPDALLSVFESRGSNTLIPGKPGRQPRARVRDQYEASLRFLVMGDTDLTTGEPFDPAVTPEAGLALNLRAFEELVVNDPGDARGRLDVDIEEADGTVTSGLIQVVSWRAREDGGSVDTAGLLRVVVPTGQLTAGGSA